MNYEGQAAVELEAACDPGETGAYPMPVSPHLVLDARATDEVEPGRVAVVVDHRLVRHAHRLLGVAAGVVADSD